LGAPPPGRSYKASKQWRIAEAVIRYAGESRVQRLPLVRARWHGVGRQIRVSTPGTNVSHTLFGALNLRTGRWAYLVRERLVKEDVLAFREHPLAAIRPVPSR
jgi:hypothetical protein